MDLLIVGDIQTVLEGRVAESALCPVLLDKMPYALGGGAIRQKDQLALGETIVYEGVGYIFINNESWRQERVLNAAFLMGIERKPSEPLKIEKKQTIHTLYQELLKNYQTGFVIVGTARFSKLLAAYLKVSPIYGENVNQMREKYWNHEEFTDQEVKLFGVVLHKPDPRAFYHNPNEKATSPFPSHTHILAPSTRHLLTDSEIDSATLWIEQIDTIRQI